MAKRKLPPILKAWHQCRKEVGWTGEKIFASKKKNGRKVFRKMPAALKAKAKACVAKKMRSK